MKGYYKKNNLQSEKSSKKKAHMVIFTREDLKGTFDARGKISSFWTKRFSNILSMTPANKKI